MAAVSISSTAAAADLWVDRNSIGGPCDNGRSRAQVTRSTPWCTMAPIGDNLNPGDVVHVREGEYTEGYDCDSGCWGSAVLQVTVSGNLANPITFMAEPGEEVVFSADGGAEWGILVVGNGGANSPKHLVFDGFVTTGFIWKGVMIELTSDVVLRNLEVTSCGEGAIGILQSERVTVEGCDVHDNSLDGYTSAINYWDCGDGNVIRGNRVWNTKDEDYRETEGHGIIFDYSSYDGDPTLIENNVIWNNEGLCMNLLASSGFIIRNNTCWRNNLGRTEGTVGEIWLGGDHMTVHNNLLVSRGYGAALLINDFVSDESTIITDHNLMWSSNSSNIAGWPPWNEGTLDDYRDYSGGAWDAHSIEINPLLANPSNANFELTGGSPAIDAGTNAHSAETDVTGATRPVDGDADGSSITDMGAYEYVTAVSPTPTPTPSTTPTPSPTSTPTPTPSPSPTPTPGTGTVFWDDLDPVKEEWTSYADQGDDDWDLSSSYARSSTYSFFSSDVGSVKDAHLLTSAVVVPQEAVFSFWHTYRLEQYGDGAVIEISVDGGSTFTDLGPHILTGGYTTEIATGYGSPIGGRMAWSGGSLGEMTDVTVDLSSFEGQTAILRFRLSCDSGEGAHGWYVDDVKISGIDTGLIFGSGFEFEDLADWIVNTS